MAATIAAGRSSRSAWIAALSVEPVATPSSTRMTRSARDGRRGPVFPILALPALELPEFAGLHGRDLGRGDVQPLDERSGRGPATRRSRSRPSRAPADPGRRACGRGTRRAEPRARRPLRTPPERRPWAGPARGRRNGLQGGTSAPPGAVRRRADCERARRIRSRQRLRRAGRITSRGQRLTASSRLVTLPRTHASMAPWPSVPTAIRRARVRRASAAMSSATGRATRVPGNAIGAASRPTVPPTRPCGGSGPRRAARSPAAPGKEAWTGPPTRIRWRGPGAACRPSGPPGSRAARGAPGRRRRESPRWRRGSRPWPPGSEADRPRLAATAAGTTTTGRGDVWTRRRATLPKSARPTAPRPALPTTIRPARRDGGRARNHRGHRREARIHVVAPGLHPETHRLARPAIERRARPPPVVLLDLRVDARDASPALGDQIAADIAHQDDVEPSARNLEVSQAAKRTAASAWREPSVAARILIALTLLVRS